jgi:hypothetical protein
MGKGRLALFIAGVAICLYACDDPSLVGVDFVGSDPLSVTYYDTVSIQLSTIKFDSIATSSIDNLLIGKSRDSYLGDITAYSFFQVGRDSLSTYPDDEKAVYDSIALELVFNEYSYYDTTKLQKYYLYSLIDEMELNDDGYLYNTSTYSYGLDSIYYLGEISFYPKVHRGKAEYLRIVDEFGKALFDLLVTKDDIVTIDDDFFEYIRGFVLVPDTANTCIIGLDTETNIRLYYTQEGSQIEQAFPIANNIRFTRIKSENPVAALGRLANQQDILPSDDTDHVAFIQGGMGLGIRLEFPYLQYVRELSENSMVTDAELILRPVRKSYSGFAPLPSELAAYVVDKRNNILGQIDISTSIYYDDEFQMDTYYLVSITSFLNDQLDLLEDDGSAILFTLPDSDNAGTVNRIFFGDEKSDSRSYMRLLVMNINDTF